MLNKLKTEDVMMALECCTRGRKHKDDRPCLECPYNFCNIVGGTDERQVSGTCQGWLMKDALALLCEMDARIKELEEAVGAEFTCFVGEPHKVDHCPYADALAEKDAEIDRMKSDFEKAQCSVELLGAELGKLGLALSQVEQIARSEAITEFLARAYASAREMGDLKPYVTLEDLEEIAKEMKE